MLSNYGKREWMTILVAGLSLAILLLTVGKWFTAILVTAATAMGLAFFRDPKRVIPTQRGTMVSPADGTISSIHRIDHFEPFGGPATCVRIFLSVLNVHVNRSPCHGLVQSVTHKSGQHLNALNPASAEVNESNLIVLHHPTGLHPIAAVRQVAGLIARTIVSGVTEGQIVQRGQRIGMIKFGSTTELYLPDTLRPEVSVEQGQKVLAGSTRLAMVMAVGISDPQQSANTKDGSSSVVGTPSEEALNFSPASS